MSIKKFQILKTKKTMSWCFFDFGLSSYPTLILTFFYGAYYASNIANDTIIGTTLWGYTISSASLISFFLFSFLLIYMRSYFKKINTQMFFFFLLLIIISLFSLGFFDEGSNQYFPLIFIFLSFVSFEVLNLFYNISLKRISKSKDEGFLSNIGWAFGYLGGLLSLIIAFYFLNYTKNNGYEIFGLSSFTFIGPFVGIWTFTFCFFHFKNFQNKKFIIPKVDSLYNNFDKAKIKYFLISFFFFNNGVVSIFAFASMFASFLYNFSETEILLLGIFINLSGIIGCIIFGIYENILGVERNIFISILGLTFLSSILLFVDSKINFWIIAMSIGFFIGPIQACSRSLLVEKLNLSDQMGAFSLFSMLGNVCAILGPFLVGYVIDVFTSIKAGLFIIPLFFLLSIVPFWRKFNV